MPALNGIVCQSIRADVLANLSQALLFQHSLTLLPGLINLILDVSQRSNPTERV